MPSRYLVAVPLQEKILSPSGISPSPAGSRVGGVFTLWIAWGLLLLATLGQAPVRRTQEARVLETAREMLGTGFREWIIPHLNGELRLQKPPLAYWLSAMAFKIFGVGEWSGRLPGAVAGWLTVGITYLAARWLFTERAALFAAAALAGSSLFARHLHLAETDGMTTLFVTAAIYCMWRAAELEKVAQRGGFLYWQLSALAMGLAWVSKGPPGLYPLLFLLAIAGFYGWRKTLLSWLRSGAILTLLLIAVPWWVASRMMAPQSNAMGKELNDVLGGRDHPAWFFIYFGWVLLAAAPWSLFVILSLAKPLGWFRSLMRRTRFDLIGTVGGKTAGGPRPELSDPRAGGMLVWIAAIFVPLCFAGNKQPHYLLPLMPPLMILVGMAADSALQASAIDGLSKVARLAFSLMWVGAFFAAAGIIVAPKVMVHRIRAIDVVLAAAIIMLAAIVPWIYRRRGELIAFTALAISCALVLMLMTGLWMPSLNTSSSREIAADLQKQFGSRPLRFYGDGAYLPLCFAMRREIPYMTSPIELQKARRDFPNLVVLVQADPKARSGTPLPEFPPGLEKVTNVGAQEERLEVYEFRGSPPAMQE